MRSSYKVGIDNAVSHLNFRPNEVGGLLYDYGETLKSEQSKFRFSEKSKVSLTSNSQQNWQEPSRSLFFKKTT